MKTIMGEKVASQFSGLGTALMAVGTGGMVSEPYFVSFADGVVLVALGSGWWLASLIITYLVRREAKSDGVDADAESEPEDDKESDTGDDAAQANEEGSDADTQ